MILPIYVKLLVTVELFDLIQKKVCVYAGKAKGNKFARLMHWTYFANQLGKGISAICGPKHTPFLDRKVGGRIVGNSVGIAVSFVQFLCSLHVCYL